MNKRHHRPKMRVENNGGVSGISLGLQFDKSAFFFFLLWVLDTESTFNFNNLDISVIYTYNYINYGLKIICNAHM